MEKIEHILEQISALCGFELVWKQIGESVEKTDAFSEKYMRHRNPFCERVKKEESRLRKCCLNDNMLLITEAERRKKPFLHRCHAGVSELVIPIFRGDQCREILTAGVFRKSADRCGYETMNSLFSRVPLRDGRKLRRMAVLLDSLSPLFQEHRSLLERKQLNRTFQDPRIVVALQKIENTFHRKVTLGAVAEAVFLSPSRFSHLFQKETGVSFCEYLKQRRIREAEFLLKKTELPLFSVMERCGFHDQSRFGVFFKQCTGHSPGAYRRLFYRGGSV